MNHCVVITAYHDLPMINQFISRIPHGWGIYVHIDAKSSIKECEINPRANVYKIKKIFWGAWEHLWVFMFLLNEAYKTKRYDYFHLVTGQDYFASSPKDFDAILGETQNSYVGFFSIPNDNWGWESGTKIFKYRTISSFADIRSPFPKVINKLLYSMQKLLRITKPLPQMELYGGSVYSSLHVNFVGWLLNDKKAKDLLYSLQNTTCAEEVFIPTMIMNSPYRSKCINKHLRYDDWSVNPAPKYLDIDDVKKILDSEALFCRKIGSNKSADLIKCLDQALGLLDDSIS